MLPHVELNRTFWRLGDTEEHDPERLKAYAAFGLEGEDWTKLLERSRVVILAEAGTGKTHELRETARRLRVEGKASFFCRFDDLAEIQLADALEEGDIKELEAWLSGEEQGWFFIDSVDEARLKDLRHFERALRTIARSLGDGANRAHIFISARVSDWRATADLSLVTRWLPPHPAKEETNEETDGSEQPPENRVSIVQLAPLTSDRMRRFAASQGVPDAGLFMDAIERADAEVFAERPQDLLELIAYWREHGAIASHAELIDFNIRSKLAEPNPDRDVARPLASSKALGGAMRLAAALTFIRKNSVIVPDQPVDPDRAAASIEANGILPEWDAREIDALLNRPLFDEATYGRVRFHHRSIQEYLTARWLYGLLNDGKPRRAIEGLLFAALYDIDVVVPSMRPVAAWMALWDDRIRDRIIAIAPEVLLEHGDPSSLPVDVRSRLLRTFAELNRGRSHIDASFDLAPIRRLADSQLATTVLELLEQHRANEELRQLLLGIIWQGQIADNVHEGAYSPDARDDAERTRGYLLGRVAHMPGREAFETLIAFSQELPDRWSRDRMLVLARRRAAEDTEKNAWAASDVSDFAREAEKDPRSARDLFDLACNRLDDLKLDLEEGDASEAPTVGRIDQEIELRNWFANRLRQAARGRYSVPPEEELADAKRPDLRIHAPAIDAPVALELKIADKWTYRELIERLRNQLVGQYLRDIRSRFGVFLIVWRGQRQGWKGPVIGKLLAFPELMERLRAEARAILQERHDLEEISVVGVDLTQRGTLRRAGSSGRAASPAIAPPSAVGAFLADQEAGGVGLG